MRYAYFLALIVSGFLTLLFAVPAIAGFVGTLSAGFAAGLMTVAGQLFLLLLALLPWALLENRLYYGILLSGLALLGVAVGPPFYGRAQILTETAEVEAKILPLPDFGRPPPQTLELRRLATGAARCDALCESLLRGGDASWLTVTNLSRAGGVLHPHSQLSFALDNQGKLAVHYPDTTPELSVSTLPETQPPAAINLGGIRNVTRITGTGPDGATLFRHLQYELETPRIPTWLEPARDGDRFTGYGFAKTRETRHPMTLETLFDTLGYARAEPTPDMQERPGLSLARSIVRHKPEGGYTQPEANIVEHWLFQAQKADSLGSQEAVLVSQLIGALDRETQLRPVIKDLFTRHAQVQTIATGEILTQIETRARHRKPLHDLMESMLLDAPLSTSVIEHYRDRVFDFTVAQMKTDPVLHRSPYSPDLLKRFDIKESEIKKTLFLQDEGFRKRTTDKFWATFDRQLGMLCVVTVDNPMPVRSILVSDFVTKMRKAHAFRETPPGHDKRLEKLIRLIVRSGGGKEARALLVEFGIDPDSAASVALLTDLGEPTSDRYARCE